MFKNTQDFPLQNFPPPFSFSGSSKDAGSARRSLSTSSYHKKECSVRCAVQCIAVQCITVQDSKLKWSTVYCSYVQCITMQYSGVQYRTVQCSTRPCSTVQCNAVQCSTAHCSRVQLSTLYCSALQCSVVQYSAVQYPVCVLQYFTVQCGAGVACIQEISDTGNAACVEMLRKAY